MEAPNIRERIILREGRIVIREIPEHRAAEIDIHDGDDASEQNCYLILIDYLSGNNVSHCPVKLHAPIVQSAYDEWILAAPPEAAGVRKKPIVRFEFPVGSSGVYFPQPTNPRVNLRSIAPVRSAAIWFPGKPSPKNIEKHAGQLHAFIAARNLASPALVSKSELSLAKCGLFGILTEISVLLPSWPAGNRVKNNRPEQGRRYRR